MRVQQHLLSGFFQFKGTFLMKSERDIVKEFRRHGRREGLHNTQSESRFQPLQLQIEKTKTTPNLKPCSALAEFQKSCSGRSWSGPHISGVIQSEPSSLDKG